MDVRKNIIQAACRLFASQPAERVSVKQILEQANVSRATFYKYFGDKYDVIEAYCMDRLQSCIPQDPEYSPREFYHKMNRMVNEMILENEKLFSALIRKDKEGTLEKFVVSNVYQQAIDRFVIQAGREVNDSICAYYSFCAAGMGSMMADWLSGKCRLDLDQFTALVDHISESMLTFATAD